MLLLLLLPGGLHWWLSLLLLLLMLMFLLLLVSLLLLLLLMLYMMMHTIRRFLLAGEEAAGARGRPWGCRASGLGDIELGGYVGTRRWGLSIRSQQLGHLHMARQLTADTARRRSVSMCPIAITCVHESRTICHHRFILKFRELNIFMW